DVKGKTPLIDLASKARHKLSKAELRDRQHSLLGAKARQPKTSSVRSGDARDAPDFYCAISDACHRTPYSRQIRFTYSHSFFVPEMISSNPLPRHTLVGAIFLTAGCG